MKKSFLKRTAAALAAAIAISAMGTMTAAAETAEKNTTTGFCGVNANAVLNTLSAPAGVSVTKTSDSITVKWKSVAKADAYRLYLYNRSTGKYEKYKNTTNTTCTITDLKPNTQYKFKIAALVLKNGKYVVQTKTTAYKTTTKAASNGGTSTSSKTSTIDKKKEFVLPTAGTAMNAITNRPGTFNLTNVKVDYFLNMVSAQTYFKGEKAEVTMCFNKSKKLNEVIVTAASDEIVEEYRSKMNDDFRVQRNGTLEWDKYEKSYNLFSIRE